MFCLWICFSLFFVLHNSVSSDQVVSLTCNQTVNVTVGEHVTLKCFINWTPVDEECEVLNYDWCNTNGTKLCNRSSTKYICNLSLSDVSLTVLNVQEEESFTVEIDSNCGMAKSHPIRVQLLPGGANPAPNYGKQEEESARVTTILLCVSASVAALVILYFLYRTYRHRVDGRTYAAAGRDESA